MSLLSWLINPVPQVPHVSILVYFAHGDWWRLRSIKAVKVGGIQGIFELWVDWRRQGLVDHGLPIQPTEPLMLLNLCCSCWT